MASNAELLILIKARDQASATLSKIKGSVGGLSSAFKMAGVAAVAGLGVAAVAIGSFVKEAAEAQRIQAQTNAVLKSTGGVAGMTAAEVGKLADQLSRVIPIDDEVIQATENVLLTFTKVGKDVFPQATEAILDMATALGTDTQGAAIQIGKALQDPIRGITALRRVGVSFSADQQKVIKALVESGRAGEAQALILKELQTEFGGSARAAGETFAGKMKILGTQIGNVKEAIGMALIPVLSRGATALANFLGEHQEDVQRLATALGDRLAGAVEDVTSFLERHRQTIAGFFEAFKMGLQTLQPVFEFVATNKIAMIAAITAIGIAIALALGPVSAAALAIVGIITLVGFMRQNWDEIKAKTLEVWTSINAFMDEHLGWLKALIESTFDAIRTAIEDRLRIIRDVIAVAVALFHGDWGAAWDGMKALVRDALQMLYDDVVGRLQMLNDLFGGFPARIIAVLAGLPADLFNLGAAAVTSMGEGMWSIIDQLAGIAGAIKDRIKSILDPRNWFSTPEEHYRGLWSAAFASIGDEARKAMPGIIAALRGLQSASGGPRDALAAVTARMRRGQSYEEALAAVFARGTDFAGQAPTALAGAMVGAGAPPLRVTAPIPAFERTGQTVNFYGATIILQGEAREALAAWGLSV